MQFLFLGDIVGERGMELVSEYLPRLKHDFKPQVTIVNGENVTKTGRGISHKLFKQLMTAGADVVTLGNHAWNNAEIFDFIADTPQLVRPLNYPGDQVPGKGYSILNVNGVQVAVVNLQGRVFMELTDDPFRALDKLLQEPQLQAVSVIFVDVHAETTSEKKALALYFDGRVTAMIGTHTHVQTTDAQILPRGTAFLTDAGMTGPAEGVIGMTYESVINKFLTARPTRFAVQQAGSGVVSGCLVSVDAKTGLAKRIRPLLISKEHPYQTL
ncbi:TIGR00282 family metallophosphoesterase [Fructilactobacillus florum]|uniref:Metallophosphoesterase n=1 Tax=Fructilactobacillus florum DSM 22689 = JCM 16035 TaxID=1423745 RepID=A0A0R2CLE8_9LACO|nr:TIGR00282 family metallophosphoesterase [Fructilactobacillus florum]EKK20907.1 Phosphoesterase [Fructilactobacillus florum 2F]KRM92424.1 hypothetical protein FC87_GL000036 [Fructilactobacillus florum DSM 22689 = JCM 16035]